MTLSVIVPVYNAAIYLPECIESILSQTFHDFELILVDDGSPDVSGKICDEYAQRDSRIRVLHQINGGVTRARAAGVENALGEWICFVDADDTIPSDSLETLMSATGSDTDIVVARCNDIKIPSKMTLDEYRRCCIAGRQVHSGPFARAFRSRLFNGKTFDVPREIIRGEDLIMNVRLAFATDKAPVLINKKVYNYRQNENSVMHTTIHTADYSLLFYRYLLLAIPNPNQYINELIKRRINSLAGVIYDNPLDKSWKKTELWKHLKIDMDKAGYRMTVCERLMLWPFNRLSLRISLKLQKLLSNMSD